jgi:hypothetical protein
VSFTARIVRLSPTSTHMDKKPIPPATPHRIQTIRGKRVILDFDLAGLYGVMTKRLNEQVRRNLDRFPDDFAFPLSTSEWESLRSQFATSNRGGRRYAPYAFTEHGALMAASVLNSPRAIQVSIFVVRTFVAMREAADSTRELAAKVDELERRLESRLAKQDHAIAEIFAAIRALMSTPETGRRSIGFVRPKDD